MKTILALAFASFAAAADWSAPVEVQHDDHRIIAYRAQFTGGLLVVEVALEPGWHTFALDNQERANEMLKGRKSLGLDQPTSIKVKQGIELTGPWRQTAPKDFSKPELRWYSWGFEGRALFVAAAHTAGGGPATLAIKGQACTDSVCKNVNVEVAVPPSGGQAKPDADLASLVALHP